MCTSALLVVLAAVSAPPEKLERPEYVPPMQKRMSEPSAADPFAADARLNDVCFVDSQNGWAVGDRGVIWHTADGGKNWERQSSGVRCALGSVCFLDGEVGYVGGGFALPYCHRGAGVLLSTRDGGKTWSRNPRLALPAVKRIGFFDAARGWAVATPSTMFPAGALTTDDGGKSWKPLLGPGYSGWLTGVFFNLRNAALAGRNGTIGEISAGAVDSPLEGAFGLKNIRRVQIGPQNQLWLVGDGGTAVAADNLGAARHSLQALLPEGTAENFDFAAIAIRGPKMWIAGTPGSAVFHSADGGLTWTAFPTGSPLPLYAIAFADDLRGWAAGALGTILATTDGGRTWQPQRSGGSRAAILGLFAEAEGIPLELFAKLSAQDGYLSAVEALARRDLEVPPRDEVPLADRVHQAAVEVGASEGATAWNFPLRQKGVQISARQIVEGFDRANAGRGLAEFQAHLARQIRIWRPELIVTQEAGPRTADPLSQLVGQAVLQAVEDAADPAKFPRHIDRAGLSAWRVKKVYAVTAPGTHGAVDLTTSQLASRLGKSLADAAADPRGLIAARFAPAPATLGFRSLLGSASGESGGRELAAGMGIQAGREARRELLAQPAENLNALHRAALRRRNAQAIIELSAGNALTSAQLLAQADALIAGLDESSAGRILFQMGDMYARDGRWPMAAETYRAFVARYPHHPLAEAALLWLMRYYAGGEAAYRELRERGIGRQPSSTPSAVKQFAAVATGQEMNDAEDRFARAIALGKEVERTRPELFADPAFRFPLAAVERQKTAARQVEQFYLVESRSPRRDAWSQCALGEIHLADRKQKLPKPMLPCVRAAEKPKLDGVLDEEVWRKTKPVELAAAQRDDEDWPAVVALAYDAEFLYVAISCKKKGTGDREQGTGNGGQREGNASANEMIRPRDADLSDRDRVDILLDLDRDYSTYYRFTVDHRGWTAESCFGDSRWNPDWYVAAKEDVETWTAEIAVPLDQLAEHPPKPRDAWTIGLQRTLPGVGFQSWTAPAATDILPEGFGYLIFD